MARVKAKILSAFWVFVEYRRAVASRMFNPYRPEQHYMRGPGPRCREKQGLSQV
jgi:hypothetical protein